MRQPAPCIVDQFVHSFIIKIPEILIMGSGMSRRVLDCSRLPLPVMYRLSFGMVGFLFSSLFICLIVTTSSETDKKFTVCIHIFTI